MKKNWINKLIALLNECWRPSARNKKWEKLDLECVDRFYAISKYYGFIHRLVDNDKIDRNNVKETNYWWEFNYYWTIPNSKRNKEIQVERLLMLLSIQDNPIEFLISILK